MCRQRQPPEAGRADRRTGTNIEYHRQPSSERLICYPVSSSGGDAQAVEYVPGPDPTDVTAGDQIETSVPTLDAAPRSEVSRI